MPPPGGKPLANVFELATAAPAHPAFQRLFTVQLGRPRCVAPQQLAEKYGVPADNEQQVLSITNTTTSEQCWYNEARTHKPQTFAAAAADAAALDPTGGGGAACDFCNWQHLTAEDSWGRVEGPHAVSASNLFKYCAPAQGLVLFKHHDPHTFDLPQLMDLLSVADAWFDKAAAAAAADGAAPGPLHPLFLWNCLGRAGASQFHGHAQVLLSHAPFPQPSAAAEAAARHAAAHPGAGYYSDLESAHEAAGLLRRRGAAAAFASLTPWKDSEVRVHGASLACPAFQTLVYAALRALVDGRGTRAFNAAIYRTQPWLPGDAPGGGGAQPAVVARVSSRGSPAAKASDFGGLEVYAHASIGHTDPFVVAAALDEALARLPG